MSTTIHYASIEDIRLKAGFEKAVNLDDRYVRAARAQAQAEINGALSDAYTVPFVPAPEKIRQLTIKLAAYTLKYDAYRDVGSQKALEALRKQLAGIAAGESPISDDNGVGLATTEAVSYNFGDDVRSFTIGQRF